ncbi:Cysteine synthase 2 [Venturia inaequalis]|nr:Cysteine synthase 2 [Venturia inaequalis]
MEVFSALSAYGISLFITAHLLTLHQIHYGTSGFHCRDRQHSRQHSSDGLYNTMQMQNITAEVFTWRQLQLIFCSSSKSTPPRSNGISVYGCPSCFHRSDWEHNGYHSSDGLYNTM